MSVAALIFGSIGNFLVMFLGSALIGILFALVTALVSATPSYCPALHVPAYVLRKYVSMYVQYIYRTSIVLRPMYIRECVCMHCYICPKRTVVADQARSPPQDPLSGAGHAPGLLIPPLLHIRELGPLR